jgi:RNA polymerase sigma-70 factor (ECF subfamily)
MDSPSLALTRHPDPPPSDRATRDRTELEWIERIRASDERAFEALFRAYVDSLCSFAYSYTESRSAAQEIVQDLFCRLWEHRDSLDVPRNVNAYLYGAVRNRAINYLRTCHVERALRRRLLRAEEVQKAAGESVLAEDELNAQELAAAVERAVGEMTVRCREVFTLTRDQHLSYAEVAAVLHISPKTVEIHMGRALAFLRQRLKPWLAG